MGASVRLLSPTAVFRGSVLMGASVRLLSPIARFFILLTDLILFMTDRTGVWRFSYIRDFCLLFSEDLVPGEKHIGFGEP